MLAPYEDDEPVPRMVQLLVAVTLRSADAEWVEEMLHYLGDTTAN